MRFEDSFFSREGRYSLGVETDSGHDSGRRYLSIPVSNGLVDYEEYYELSAFDYEALLADLAAAVRFAEACRRHEHDDLLIQKPGSNRGVPV